MDLSQGYKELFPVFHVSLLQLCPNPPDRRHLDEMKTLVDREEEWEVEEVVDSKLSRGGKL